MRDGQRPNHTPVERYLESLFGLEGRVAVVTGGTGVLGGAMAKGLAQAGAKVGVLGRHRQRAEQVLAAIGQVGGQALVLQADVLDRGSLEAARDSVMDSWGRVDILVNAAGGNIPAATVGEADSVFDLHVDAWRQVVDLNLLGTLLPSQVFGASMVEQGAVEGRQRGEGCIINISSMAAQRPLTRAIGYSAAKAAVDNVTKWFAVEMARRYGPGLRVNGIAPGFFLGEQNRHLLLNQDGTLTPRGLSVIDHTPAGRFGSPDDLVGALIWLCSPAAAFVNGVVVPVDGGFSAFGGV